MNVNTLEHVAAKKLELNDIGVCALELDPPDRVRAVHARIAISAGSSSSTASRTPPSAPGCCILRCVAPTTSTGRRSTSTSRRARELKGQKPCVVWFTGLSGAGKSTIANLLEKRLHALGRHTYLLDGDNVRHGLNKDLGFTDADRVENIRRVAEVARLMADAGLIVLVSFISPFRAERRMARGLMDEGEFFEVFVDAPLAGGGDARSEGPVQEGASRRAEELHWCGLAVRGAGSSGDDGSTPRS